MELSAAVRIEVNIPRHDEGTINFSSLAGAEEFIRLFKQVDCSQENVCLELIDENYCVRASKYVPLSEFRETWLTNSYPSGMMTGHSIPKSF